MSERLARSEKLHHTSLLCSAADRRIHDELTQVVSACIEQHTEAGGTLLLVADALLGAAEALPPSQVGRGCMLRLVIVSLIRASSFRPIAS